MAIKLVAFAGSLRTESFNKKLVKIAAEGARQAGAEVIYQDLRDLALPNFDAHLEKSDGPPLKAVEFKKQLAESDGMLISSPEYNSSISGALKNAIDWASRPAAGEPPLVAFKGKAAALMAASPGALGGLRGLVHLRAILGNIGVIVLPEQVAVSRAAEAFDEHGNLRDAKQQESILNLGRKLVDIAGRLRR